MSTWLWFLDNRVVIVSPELHREGLNLGGGFFFKETLSGRRLLANARK